MASHEFTHAMDVLEFRAVMAQIESFAACTLGKERIAQMRPYAQLEEATRELAGVDESYRHLYRTGPLPFGGVTDVRSFLQRARIGAVLTPQALLSVANFIYGGRRVRQTLVSLEDPSSYPLLTELGQQLYDARQVEQELRGAISDEATVHDGASSRLRQLRQEKRQTEGRIRQVLEGIIRAHPKLLQEPVITLRGDSLCLPVRVENKNQIRGIIHDYSSSGATVFVEPMAVVELGQKVQDIAIEEEREVERILQQLSGLVATIAEPLEANTAVLAVLDGWFAKAEYARTERCEQPLLNSRSIWKLRQVRHPLIPRGAAVPMDVILGESYSMIVITGPNTGGKTVALKTVGLVTLLAMAGCFIPGAPGCEIAWCNGVFVDIGDEQSIEQSLSTFSSHMTNIVSILRQAGAGSLVLLDELGAGTDPAEGAALAVAILDQLHRQRTAVMATTHYARLKAYGFSANHAINASVEFDLDTLRPTYRLLVGIPGRSNALAIASRLGLPETVVVQARQQLQGDDIRTEDLIGQMEEARREADAARQDTLRQHAQVEQLRREWEEKAQDIRRREEAVLQQAATKAAQMLQHAESEADRIIKELRKRQNQPFKDHELVQLKKELQGAAPQGRASAHWATTKGSGPAEVGCIVRVLSLNQEGEVTEVYAGGKELAVQLGMLKMKVKAVDVEVVRSAASIQPPEQAPVSRRRLNKSVPLQLDIRGMTVEEAMPVLDKYLDDAIMAHVQRVTVIHGKGTGALRDGVRRYLGGHKQVQSCSPGGPGEGGDGATVVEVTI